MIFLSFRGYFDQDPEDSCGLPARLERAYGMFYLWTVSEQKTTSLRHFTPANMHFTSNKFPYMGGKGADTTLVLRFLSFYLVLCLQNVRHDEDAPILSASLQLVQGLLTFLGIMHSHGLFLNVACGTLMWQSGLRALRSYSFCAKRCMDMRLRLFGLRPKFHSFAHTIFEVRDILRVSNVCLSPITWNCEANEDFIGRISRVSRHVASRQVILRTIQRYGVSLQLRLNRLNILR